MKLVLLGTGTPNAEPWASFPAYAVIHSGNVFLFDCGAGIVRACTSMFYKGVNELKPQNLTHLFLTHMHSDHTAGLAELILIPWVLERSDPLHVYGPAGVSEMAEHLLAAYRIDTDYRNDGPQPSNPTGHHVLPQIVTEGTVYNKNSVRIEAMRGSHGELESYAYRIEADGKRIVISGDTAPLESMKTFAEDADILVHEAEYAAGLQERSEGWQKYHQSIHTMSYDLAEIINGARPALTITTHRILHLNYYGESPVSMEEVRRREDALLAEIQSRTSLPVKNGYDQNIYEI